MPWAMATEIDDLGDTPLIRAAKERDEAAVAALVADGISLDGTNRFGQTALSWAVRHGELGIVKKLLAAGASAEHAPPPAWTPLVWASAEGHLEIAKLLIEADKGPNPARSHALLVAVMRDRPPIVKLLLANGADDSVRDADGFTPLMLAAFDGSTELVRLLLGGAHASLSRDAAFLNAAAGGHAAAVSLFIEAGVDVDQVSAKGNSALGMAKKRRRKEVVALLVKHGAGVAKAATKKRVVPEAPQWPARARGAAADALCEGLVATTSAKRRSAAKKIRAAADAVFEPALVDALAKEMGDVRPWETQYELAAALGACATAPQTARWLERLTFEIAYDATMVPASLVGAAVRIAARAGTLDAESLLSAALDRALSDGQRFATLWGILGATNELGVVLGPAIRARLDGVLAEADGVHEQWGAMLENARRAIAAAR